MFVEEAKARTAQERAEVMAARESLERDRTAFEQDVATLRELSLQVQAESVAVKEAARVSQQEHTESRRLHAGAAAERAAAEGERARAEQVSRCASCTSCALRALLRPSAPRPPCCASHCVCAPLLCCISALRLCPAPLHVRRPASCTSSGEASSWNGLRLQKRARSSSRSAPRRWAYPRHANGYAPLMHRSCNAD